MKGRPPITIHLHAGSSLKVRMEHVWAAADCQQPMHLAAWAPVGRSGLRARAGRYVEQWDEEPEPEEDSY